MKTVGYVLIVIGALHSLSGIFDEYNVISQTASPAQDTIGKIDLLSYVDPLDRILSPWGGIASGAVVAAFGYYMVFKYA